MWAHLRHEFFFESGARCRSRADLNILHKVLFRTETEGECQRLLSREAVRFAICHSFERRCDA